MKKLAVSTVCKGLKKIGFVTVKECPNEQIIYMSLLCNSGALYAEIDSRIKFHDARWKLAPNVHIVSYFGWPRDGRELARMIDEVKRIYGELCGFRF